jgi:hypothetical protein
MVPFIKSFISEGLLVGYPKSSDNMIGFVIEDALSDPHFLCNLDNQSLA